MDMSISKIVNVNVFFFFLLLQLGIIITGTFGVSLSLLLPLCYNPLHCVEMTCSHDEAINVTYTSIVCTVTILWCYKTQIKCLKLLIF